jgi:NADPH-dependent 2,4-dienoyl-CoA reductase/sulfur reductase-like enzyme
MAEPRIIVIGAGPAGARAAETLVEAGFRPVVIDESARDGGQIYRRQPNGFLRPKTMLYGSETTQAEALHMSFDLIKPLIDYRPRHLAWNIADAHVHIAHAGGADALPYDALIIAAGATDRLMPVKGWQFAGTFSLGATLGIYGDRPAAISCRCAVCEGRRDGRCRARYVAVACAGRGTAEARCTA